MTSIHSHNYQLFLSKLVNARKDSSLTQLEVANKLGKPQSFVSKCESGERRVDVIELNQFAKLYEKDLSYFLAEKAKA